MRFERRRVTHPDPERPLPLEIAFLRDWVNPQSDLHEAARRARRQGDCPARVLIAEGFVSEPLFYRALARHLRIPYVDGWPALAESVDLIAAVGAGRVRTGDARSLLLAPEGTALRWLLHRQVQGLGLPRIALTTPSHLRAILRVRCDRTVAYLASEVLPDTAPMLSARGMTDWRVRAASVGLPIAAIGGLALVPHLVADGFGLLFFAALVLRLVICAAGLDQRHAPPPPVAEADLPLYSILIPLRHETDVVQGLVAALERLDYPRAKIEALFLVEPEDRATRDTLAAIRLPPWCHVVVGPFDGKRLRTKPRALNVGLLFARGSLLTVYDAEDRPDPDQLRLAAARFAASSDQLACLQARLAIANGKSSWLSRLFAIEYAALFDLFNIGAAASRLPLALGGTSNHFRVSALRAVGGWDAWNVTEDADLGFRLARFGYRIGIISSTTMEDAPEKIGAWMRQRRRWTKGWMQTLLVLAWSARDAGRHYGPVTSMVVVLMLVNLAIGPPLLPLFAAAVITHFVQRGLPDAGSLLRIAEATLACSVFSMGVASTLWVGYAGLRIRRLGAFVSCLPLLLPYQLLISVAAWLALLDLLRNPFHWHKTEHGRASRRRP